MLYLSISSGCSSKYGEGIRMSANWLIGSIVGAVVISGLLIMGFYI